MVTVTAVTRVIPVPRVIHMIGVRIVTGGLAVVSVVIV
jgi:hypothetical protein